MQPINGVVVQQQHTFPALASGETAIVYVDIEVPAGTPIEVGFTGINNQRPALTANAIGNGMAQVILRNNKPDGYLNLQPGTLTLIALMPAEGGGE